MKRISILLICMSYFWGMNAERLDSILTIANNYGIIGDWDKALEVITNEFYIATDRNKKSEETATLHTVLANYYSNRGKGDDYLSAIQHTQEAMNIYHKESVNHINCYHKLAYYYYLHDENNKADDISSIAIIMSKKFHGTNANNFAAEMKAYSDQYSDYGNYALANKYAQYYFSVMDSTGNTNNIEYADKLYDIASYYNGERNYQAELDCLLKAESIIKSLYSPHSSEYLHCIYRVSIAYNLLRRMEEYEKWESVARDILVDLGIYEAVNVKETPLYSNMSKKYGDAGDYVNAIKTEEISLNIYAAHQDSVSMAKSFNTISNYYYRDGDLSNALEYCTYAVDIYNTKQISSIEHALALNNMSVYMHDKKDDKTALTFATKGLKMFELTADTINDKGAKSFYRNMLTNIALYHNILGNIDEARKYGKQSTAINSTIETGSTQNTVINYYNEAMIAYSAKKVEDLEISYHKALTLQTAIIKKEFPKISKSEKNDYWKNKNFIFENSPIITYSYNHSDSIATDAYNALLFKRQIEKNGDIEAPTVEKISKKLKDGEMAIEFFHINSQNVGKAYAALIINAGIDTAKCVKLFVEKDLHNIEFYDNADFYELANTAEGRNTIFKDSRVGMKIWQHLLPFMKGIKKIYYTPCDFINSFKIEDLICEDNYEGESKPLSQIYNFLRIASTGNIAIERIEEMVVSQTPISEYK